MISDQEVLRLFEGAKPAPVDDAASVLDAAGYLDALLARNNDSTRHESEPTQLPVRDGAIVVDLESAQGARSGRRRWPVAAAALAAVVLLAAGTVLVTGGRHVGIDSIRGHGTLIGRTYVAACAAVLGDGNVPASDSP